MKKVFTYIIGVILSASSVEAQTLRGQVLSAADSGSIAHSTITCYPSKKSVVANATGWFVLDHMNQLPTLISITASGFQPVQLSIADTTIALVIYLKPAYTALEEVVVTGTGSAAKLKSVPVAIATVSAKDLMLHPNTNAIDALSRTVSGLQTITTGPNVSKPSIRGLGYNRVLTLFDGIRQEGQQWADEHGIEADQYNIARAEVIKGPASIAYGSDAMAGVINLLPFIPAQPTTGVKGNAMMEAFSNNGMGAASVGLYQFKNSFFWTGRVSFKAAKDYQNKIDGRVFNTGFQEGNGSLAAGIQKKVVRSYGAFTLYNNLQKIPDGSRDSLTRRFTYQVAEGTMDDMNNRPIVPQARLNSYVIDPLHQHIRHYRLYNKTKLKLGSGQLQSALSFTKNIRQEYNHPTQPKQAGLFIVLNTFQYSLSYSTNLWKDYQLTSGLNAMYQTNRSRRGTDFPIPDYNLSDGGAFTMLRKEWEKVSLSGGLRYDARHIHWNDFYTSTNPATGFDYHLTSRDTAGATLAFNRYGKTFSGVTASVGATYTINRHWFVKANVARGYRSPNITEIGANGLDPGAHIYYIGNRNFSPEFNWQQDAGVFFNGGGLEASVEVFNNQLSNYIFLEKMLDANGQPAELVSGNSTYTYRQGAARLYGLEANIKYAPPFVKWLKLQTVVSSVTGMNEDKMQRKLYGNAARYLPMISPIRLLSAIRIELPKITAIIQKPFIRLEADVYAAQRKFYAVQATEAATPGYQLWNAAVGFEVYNKGGEPLLSVSLQAENILDIAYQSHLNRLKYFENYAASLNGRSGIYNMGRNVSLRVGVSF